MSRLSELYNEVSHFLGRKRGRKSNREKEAERELALEDNQKADADGLSLISMKRTQYGTERPVFGVLQDDGTTKGTIYAFEDSDGRQRLIVEYKGKKKVISPPNTIVPIRFVTKGQIKQAIEFINSLD